MSRKIVLVLHVIHLAVLVLVLVTMHIRPPVQRSAPQIDYAMQATYHNDPCRWTDADGCGEWRRSLQTGAEP